VARLLAALDFASLEHQASIESDTGGRSAGDELLLRCKTTTARNAGPGWRWPLDAQAVDAEQRFGLV
jgi:hypothetical protein